MKLFEKIKRFFKKQTTTLDVLSLMKHISDYRYYISCGTRNNKIINKSLTDNKRILIGIGETVSGFGDWGGGYDYLRTCPVFITIDEQMNIINLDYDDFYNSKNSQEVKEKCKKWVGEKKFLKLSVPEKSNLNADIQSAIFMLGTTVHDPIHSIYVPLTH